MLTKSQASVLTLQSSTENKTADYYFEDYSRLTISNSQFIINDSASYLKVHKTSEKWQTIPKQAILIKQKAQFNGS